MLTCISPLNCPFPVLSTLTEPPGSEHQCPHFHRHAVQTLLRTEVTREQLEVAHANCSLDLQQLQFYFVFC